MTSDERTLDKIRKLLQKSRDAGASEAEAASCAEKARELMEQHSVSEESLRERQSSPGRLYFEAKYMDPWRKNLGTAVGYSYGCVMTWHPSTRQFCFTGSPTGVEVCRDVYQHLERTVTRLAAAYRSAVKGTRAQQLNFERGCGERLATRIMIMSAQREQCSSPDGASTALVLRSDYDQSKEWLTQNTKLREENPKSAATDLRATLAGARAAEDVNVGRGIE